MTSCCFRVDVAAQTESHTHGSRRRTREPCTPKTDGPVRTQACARWSYREQPALSLSQRVDINSASVLHSNYSFLTPCILLLSSAHPTPKPTLDSGFCTYFCPCLRTRSPLLRRSRTLYTGFCHGRTRVINLAACDP